MKPTHQHSLGIHSTRVHIHRTASLRSWEGKHTGHLDCTHPQPHQHHHRHTLEEEKEANELLMGGSFVGIALKAHKMYKTML